MVLLILHLMEAELRLPFCIDPIKSFDLITLIRLVKHVSVPG